MAFFNTFFTKNNSEEIQKIIKSMQKHMTIVDITELLKNKSELEKNQLILPALVSSLRKKQTDTFNNLLTCANQQNVKLDINSNIIPTTKKYFTDSFFSKKSYMTLLDLAIEQNNANAVENLLANGAKLGRKDIFANNGSTTAVSRQILNVKGLFVKNNYFSDVNDSEVARMIMLDRLKRFKTLLESKNKEKKTTNKWSLSKFTDKIFGANLRLIRKEKINAIDALIEHLDKDQKDSSNSLRKDLPNTLNGKKGKLANLYQDFNKRLIELQDVKSDRNLTSFNQKQTFRTKINDSNDREDRMRYS